MADLEYFQSFNNARTVIAMTYINEEFSGAGRGAPINHMHYLIERRALMIKAQAYKK